MTFAWVVCSPKPKILSLHITWHGNEPQLTLAMSSQCCFYKVQELIVKLNLVHFVLFSKFLGDLDFVGMVMQIFVKNLLNAVVL
jgi:hypothetical protein